MSVSPVAMFEPVLRDLQCLTAPDVDAEREATLCQHISTGIQIWSDLPDSEFTAAVWEELVMVRQVRSTREKGPENCRKHSVPFACWPS